MTFERARKWSGIAILVLIIGAAIWGFGFGSFCYFHLGIIQLMCPVGFVELCLSNRTIYWNLVPPFLLVIGLIILLGRMFCSWICPVALLGGWFKSLLLRAMPQGVSTWWKKRGIHVVKTLPKCGYKDGIAITIGAFAGVAIFGFPFISGFCPIGIITRNLIGLFTHFQLHADLVLLFIPVCFGALFFHGWRNVCPVGAFRGLIAGINHTFVPVVNHSLCNGCRTCERVCPFGLSPQNDNLDSRFCVKCLKCIDECPQRAISLSFLPRDREGHTTCPRVHAKALHSNQAS